MSECSIGESIKLLCKTRKGAYNSVEDSIHDVVVHEVLQFTIECARACVCVDYNSSSEPA